MDWKTVGVILSAYGIGVLASYNHFVWNIEVLRFGMGVPMILVYLVFKHKD